MWIGATTLEIYLAIYNKAKHMLFYDWTISSLQTPPNEICSWIHSNTCIRMLIENFVASIKVARKLNCVIVIYWTLFSNKITELFLFLRTTVFLSKTNIRWKWKWKPLSRVRLLAAQSILQARIQKLVAFPFSGASSQPRNQTHVSHIADGFFTSWATREAQEYWKG